MMHKRMVALFLLAACSPSTDIPPDLLERDRFTDVLLEAQMIEARLNHEMVIDKRADSPVQAYYDSLFTREGIDQEQFTRTYRYYAGRPEELKAIYEEVLTRLAHEQDSVQ